MSSPPMSPSTDGRSTIFGRKPLGEHSLRQFSKTLPGSRRADLLARELTSVLAASGSAAWRSSSCMSGTRRQLAQLLLALRATARLQAALPRHASSRLVFARADGSGLASTRFDGILAFGEALARRSTAIASALQRVWTLHEAADTTCLPSHARQSSRAGRSGLDRQLGRRRASREIREFLLEPAAQLCATRAHRPSMACATRRMGCTRLQQAGVALRRLSAESRCAARSMRGASATVHIPRQQYAQRDDGHPDDPRV